MVQLWSPPSKKSDAPSSLLALRFTNPLSVSFVTTASRARATPVAWPFLLHEDELEPSPIEYGSFAFSSRERLAELLASAQRIETLYGFDPVLDEVLAAPCSLSFAAGLGVLIVAAESVVAVSHEGELSPRAVIERNARWWAYWKEYWARRETRTRLPYDPTCEVTIPAAPPKP